MATTSNGDRLLNWAERRPERFRRRNPWEIAAHVAHAAGGHRITGLAAEMSFFALLTLVPSTIAVGAALSLLQRIVGPSQILQVQDAAIDAIRVVISPKLADDVGPYIRAQLAQQGGRVALGGLLLTWWLSSRLFLSTSHAMDLAYRVSDRRNTLKQRFIALALALGSVLVVAMTLGLMVVGPLADIRLSDQLDLGRLLRQIWQIGRWPLLLLILLAFLLSLYRFCPNVRHGWRQCLPGAVLGVLLWIAAAVGFRIYLALGAGAPRDVLTTNANVLIVGNAVGAVIATVLWTFCSSVAILVGAELNAELARQPAASDHAQRTSASG